VVRDSRGRLLAEGSGRSLRIPAAEGPGLLFFQSRTGTETLQGRLIDIR
jgi:hypothetical protein